MNTIPRFLARMAAGPIFCAALLLSGCTQNVIDGTVLTIEGETLPGVAVEIVGTDRQALTNARGEYHLRYAPAETLQLSFFKTGYTPGRMDLPLDGEGAVSAAPVSLWPLPNQSGVYLYEEYEYVRARPIEPELYETEATGTIYGTITGSDVVTMDQQPLLLCYKMPKYGAHLYRMQLLEGTPADAESEEDRFNVWVPVREVPTAYTAIDEPDGHLMQVQPLQPLAPDHTYAVEFGRVAGGESRETRMFLFHVTEAFENVPPGEPAGPAAESGEDAQPAEETEADPEPGDAAEDTGDDGGGF